MAENSNKIIGDYELIALLGDGAQGRVFKARAITGSAKVPEGTTVAIKVLTRATADPKEDIRFKRQADILSKLSHPAICHYVDYFIWQEGEFDELKCLVMEFLDGESLSDRIARHRKGLPWEEVYAIFDACISALVHAAEHGVVHRDLKPSNLFITREGAAKVIDFGIARKEGGDETSTGGWKGSFDFMAPDFVNLEGFGGDEVSDVFSLSVCFFQALTGELPFPSLGMNAHIGYLNRWKGETPQTSFSSDKFRVLLNCRSMVRKGLNPDRDQRYPSFAAMLEDLHKIRYRVVRHHGKEDYELVEVLGRGGFGEVYKGRCVSDGRLVAVKHLFAGRQSSRFIKEARLLQEYKHPDIVDYVDFIEIEGMGDDKEYFLIMEYLPGMPEADLRRRIRLSRTGLDVGEVLELFWHYLRALQYLHENPRPIIHRDIKPGNLYAPIGHPERAKIFDLGVARDVSGTLTTGMIPGTLDYMAPEFARPGAERGSPQSDLYALGVALYEALTGKKPLPKLPKADQEAFVQFVARAQNPPPIPFDAPVFQAWPQLKQILRMALASEPAERYASAGDMLREVDVLLRKVAEVAADESEAPTRATQMNPELLERIQQAAAAQIEQPPASAFETEEQETAFRPASGELDVDEEGAAALAPPPMMPSGTPSPSRSPSPLPTPGQPTPTPGYAPTPTPAPKPKQSWSALALKGLGGALVLALALYGGYTVVRGIPAGVARNEISSYVQANQIPEPTTEYLERFREAFDKTEEWRGKDLANRVFWDDRIEDLHHISAQFPLAFRREFDAAVQRIDLARAQQIFADWSGLEPEMDRFRLEENAFQIQQDAMRTQLDRLEFLDVVRRMDDTLPEPILTREHVQAAEQVARLYRESLDREWRGVTQAEVDEELSRVREALTRRGNDYITQTRNFAVTRYQNLESGDAQWESLRAMAVNAPTLVGLIGQPYETAMTDVNQAKAVKEGQAGYVAMVERMDERMPATVTTAADVQRLEEAATLFAEFSVTDWQGIEPGSFEEDSERIGSAITELATAYVQELTTRATERLGQLEDAEEEWNALQAFGENASSAVARVQALYDRSVRNIGGMRAELENRQAFAGAVAGVRDRTPADLTTEADLTAAESAAAAYREFAERDWTGIDPTEVASEEAALRSALVNGFTAYLQALKDRALERYGRMEDAAEEWEALSTLSERAPALVGLAEAEYRTALQEVGRARGDKEVYAEFMMARNQVTSLLPATVEDAESLRKAEEAAAQYEVFAARTFEGIPDEEQETVRRELRTRLASLANDYIEELKNTALERFAALEEADDQWRQLQAIDAEAPKLAQLVRRTYDQTLRMVGEARDNRENLAAYMTARNAVSQALPAEIATAADLTQAEQAASALQTFTARTWENIDAQEQAQEKERLREELVSRAESYIADLRQRALAQLDDLEDADAELQDLRAVRDRAPTLATLLGADYEDAVRSVELAQRMKEGITEFTTALQELNDLLRGDIDGAEQLARKEEALVKLEAMRAEDWEGVDEAEQRKAFSEIDAALTRSISTYLTELRGTALNRLAALENAEAQLQALREIETHAPTLSARVADDYRQAIAAVESASQERERLVAFQQALDAFDALRPAALTTEEQLGQANRAVAAVEELEAQAWEGVPRDRRDNAILDRRASLVDMVNARVAELRREALTRYERLEDGDDAWNFLREMETAAPALTAMVAQEYRDAVAETTAARARKVGITEFRDAIARIERAVPDAIETDAQVRRAEQAATALRQVQERDWEGVPSAERTAAAREVEEKLVALADARIVALADDAVTKFDAMEDGEPSWLALDALARNAPGLVQATGERYTVAMQRAQAARDRKLGQSEFRDAMAAIRGATPAQIRSAEDLAAAEEAAGLYAEAAERTWRAVAAAERRTGLNSARDSLERLFRGRVDELRSEAETLYRRQESGDAQLQALEELAQAAPQLVALNPSHHEAALVSVRGARERMGALLAFRNEVERVRALIPEEVTGRTELARGEQAVSAYQGLAAGDWPDVPSSEKTDALAQLRNALVNGVTAYVETLSGRATEQYGQLEDAGPLLDELAGASREAPNLIGMIFNAYERAVAEVRSAREQMRVALIEKEEADAFARVETAWETVQAAWNRGIVTGMGEAYQTILDAGFELPKFAEPYAAIRTAFSEGLQSRLGGLLTDAEASITEFLAFMFQVSDPSLSGSYRMLNEDPPGIAFELPPISDLRELDLGVPYLALVRLEAWSRSADALETARQRRALATSLRELAEECRRQGLAEEAAIAEFHRAVLESQPQLFPREMSGLDTPLDLRRWRAHANYQPEVSSLDVLADLSGYAAGGGPLNEFDLRLAFFAAYYSWRNAIDGENEYAQRVRDYLKAVIERADADTADAAVDFLIEFAETAFDDEEEFPGLYVMRAVSRMSSEAPAVKQARDWLASNGSLPPFSDHFAAIQPQVDLLDRLLQ